MSRLHVLRVFIGPDGGGGNPLGVFLDGGAIPEGRRQAIAADLGFSETVFVEAIDRAGRSATIRIFTPGTELAFAGHPTVGTAWLLAHVGDEVDTLRCRAGDVGTWQDDGARWVRARAAWIHPIEVIQLPDPAAVEADRPGALGDPGRYVWAWEDEAAGRLRSRYFATDVGIVEDEATGAAAVVMGDRLGRDLVIHQGVGSEILVRPDAASGTVAIGGLAETVETRDHVDPGAGG